MKRIFFFLFPAILLTLPITAAQAQSTKPQFQPGSWQITSTVTAMGRTVHYTNNVCVKNPAEAWQNSSEHEKCAAPTVTTIADGYNIKLNCTGGTGPVQWKSASDINETFSDHGAALKADGTTKTTVSYSGHAPINSTATVHSTGKLLGACK